MQTRTRQKHRGQPWLTANITGSDITIRGFHSRANCKAHVLKHVLGLMYEDTAWDRERWDLLLAFDRDELISQLSEMGCPAIAQRMEIRRLDSLATFDRTCIECEATSPKPDSCDRVLELLLHSYQEAIKRGLRYGQKLPRFTRHIEIREETQGLDGMYHLDSTGLFIVSRRPHAGQPGQLRVVTCYRPLPPVNVKWSEGCLKYAKSKCLQKYSTGIIRILLLCNEDTWGFKLIDEESQNRTGSTQPKAPYPTKRQGSRGKHMLYDSLDDRTKGALQALKERLAEGERRRRSQRS